MPKSLFQQLVEQTCQQAKSNNQNAKPAAAPLDPARKAKIAAALEYAQRLRGVAGFGNVPEPLPMRNSRGQSFTTSTSRPRSRSPRTS